MRRRGPPPGGRAAGAARIPARGALALALVLLPAAAACGTGRGPPEGSPEAERPVLPTREPFVRVGLHVGRDSVRASAPGGLRVTRIGSGRAVPDAGGAGPWTFRAEKAGAEAVPPSGRGSGAEVAGRFRLRPEGEGPVVLEGRPYRGLLDVYRVPGHDLVVVNQLDLEAYLLGVVPVEIGPRSGDEMAAVKAQAVAARTYAVRNLGRRDSLGFDVFGNVEDQVYGGREVERPDATRAVRATAGEVLTWRGRPVRAYYHSTGGGTTARVTDVWNLPDAPYLKRVSDRRPAGGHYCDISPRYRWTESWTPAELRASVRAGLERRFGVDDSVGEVRSIRIASRVPGGRIDELEVRTDAGLWVVTRNDIRFFLRTPDGRPLRSTRFDVVRGPARGGGLELRGRGYGHGVGMCQWGAIGRARAGHSYREILAHYYPGTELVEAY